MPKTARAFAFGNEALRMEVSDPVNEIFSQQNIERRNEMQHQRWAAGKEEGIGAPHRCKRGAQQQQIGKNGPGQARQKLLFLVGPPVDADDLKRARADQSLDLPESLLRWQDQPGSHPSLHSPTGEQTEPHIVRPHQSLAAANRRCKPTASLLCRTIRSRTPRTLGGLPTSFGEAVAWPRLSALPLAFRITWALIHS